MKPEGFSQEAWDALTEEEQAGMLEEINEDVIHEEGKQESGEKSPEELAAAEGDKAGEEGTKEPDTNANEEGKQDKEPEQPAYVHKPKPMFNAQLPDDFDGQVKAIREQKRELAKKFDEGEISVTDYQEQLEDLNDKQFDLRELKLKAQLAQEAQQSAAEDDWGTTVESFLKSHPETNKTPFRFQAFDMAVRMVTGDKANENLTNLQQLEKAYENFSTEFGITAEPAQQQKPTQPAKGAKPVVPNIGNLPAADINETDNGKFAALDRLLETDSLRYQDELGKMSAADRELYLSM